MNHAEIRKEFPNLMLFCGLENIGFREGFETHGSLHNTPAVIMRSECSEESIYIEAEISLTELFCKIW